MKRRRRHDFGCFDSNDLSDIDNSRTIFLWGKNVAVSSVHLIPLLKAARRRGARVVLIDPVHHQTAQWCDLFIQPRAGTDAAVAMGIARWLFEQGRIGPDRGPILRPLGAPTGSWPTRGSLDDWARLADVAPEAMVEFAKPMPTARLPS